MERKNARAASAEFERLIQSGLGRDEVEAFEAALAEALPSTSIVRPSYRPSKTRTPRGRLTVRGKFDVAAENVRGIESENASARALAKSGYDVEQNPTVPGTKKRPDYSIEGEIFDNYAPTTAEIDSVWGNVEEKVRRKQTRRVVINVDSSPVDLAKLREAFEDQPIDDLEQVLVVNGNSVTELWP
jgi:hypothetical protein|nr:hypothetical protein [Kofleriaceae bacterium]